ncbi:MAG TPA: M20/M25/M40 family metallo-hydrolase [Gaiellaceae bacterium]|nr:M20/M25/M40 family metallo-hydrolase [Gaiellaceae bacterium]
MHTVHDASASHGSGESLDGASRLHSAAVPPSPEQLRDRLAELIAIPSVSADAGNASDVERAAVWIAELIREARGTVDVVPWNGGRPLVIGEVAASERPESAPTILCYAHFDVQPPDPLELWETPPFELTRRDGRLYARGVADDKGNLFVLVEAVRQLAEAGELPVNVRFGFDGEEEVGGDSIVEWVEQDEGAADAALILDGAMARRGQPVFYVGVRGMLYFHLRLRTGTTDMHSGMFGAAALNAGHALMTALASVVPRPDGYLRDELRVGATPPTGEELEAWAQLPSGSEQLSHYGAVPIAPGAPDEFYRRTFADTSLDVNGFASGSPDLVKTVLPVEARANVSIRLAPGQDPDEIHAVFERLLREATPVGAELEIALRNRAHPAMTPTDAPAIRLAGDAFEHVVGARPLLVRSGGTLPIYAGLVRRGLPTLATGFGVESECNVHAPNENVPDDALEVGVATMREVFLRLGQLGA